MRKPTVDQLAEKVAKWNEQCPIGTPVVKHQYIQPRGGEQTITQTRSAAWVMGGHSAVVLVEGFTGAVDLESLSLLSGFSGSFVVAVNGKDKQAVEAYHDKMESALREWVGNYIVEHPSEAMLSFDVARKEVVPI